MKLRRHERILVQISTTAHAPAVTVDVDVTDISISGCRICSSSPSLRVGATVLLRLSSRDEVAGQIVWVAGELAGVEFHRLIDHAAMDVIAGGVGNPWATA